MNSMLGCSAKFASRTHNSSKKLHTNLCPSRSLHISLIMNCSSHFSCTEMSTITYSDTVQERINTWEIATAKIQLCARQHFSQVDHDAAWAAPSLLAPLSNFFLDPLFWGFSSSWFFTTGLNCQKRMNRTIRYIMASILKSKTNDTSARLLDIQKNRHVKDK